jgi:hypothetical protein
MMLTILGSIVNRDWDDLHDHLKSTRTFTLTMKQGYDYMHDLFHPTRGKVGAKKNIQITHVYHSSNTTFKVVSWGGDL